MQEGSDSRCKEREVDPPTLFAPIWEKVQEMQRVLLTDTEIEGII
jgi:hypothetical protein